MDSVEKLMDPVLFKIFDDLAAALVSYTPGHFIHIQCVIELGSVQGNEQPFFHISSPDYPDQSTTRVNRTVADATNDLLFYFEDKGEPFPGFRIIMQQQSDQQWKSTFSRLDAEKDFVSPIARPLERAIKVCGYGVKLTPIGPFHWYQLKDPPAAVNAQRFIKSEDGTRTLATLGALLLIQNGSVEVKLQGEAKEETQVYKRESTPQSENSWTIETLRFKCKWPVEWALRYPAASGTMFDFVQSDNSLAYLQGPFTDAQFDLSDVADESQTVVAQGSEPCPWTELSYEIKEQEWRQRYYALAYDATRRLCLTVQCPVEKADAVFESASLIALSMQPVVDPQ